MANELESTVETTENSTKQNSEQDTVDLKELQMQVKALTAERDKLRQSVTSASADASKWKKQYQEKLSAEEQAQIKQDEATAAMQKELEDLRKERNIAKISGALVAQDIGMDAETAGKVAEAMNAGEIDKVLNGIREFVITHDKAIQESAIRNNQTLKGGKSEPTVTKADFDNMGYREMVEFKQTNPELYNEYMKR
jgi:hypothetical protein